MRWRLYLAAGLAGAVLAASVAGQQPSNPATTHLPPGVLQQVPRPDSLALLPPPPAPGSAAMRRDEEARKSVTRLRGTARWELASSDADLGFPHAPAAFSCATGVTISKEA